MPNRPNPSNKKSNMDLETCIFGIGSIPTSIFEYKVLDWINMKENAFRGVTMVKKGNKYVM